MQQGKAELVIKVTNGPGGILPEKFGWDVRPAPQNHYLIYDCDFSYRIYMTRPKVRYPIYDRCS